MGVKQMRERLIEILRQPIHLHLDADPTEALADYLLDSGVAVPVRCKDCKHWADGVRGCTDHVKCCKIGFYMVGENGYCSYGERSADG